MAEYIPNRSLREGLIDLMDSSQALQVVTDPELLKLALEQVLDNAVEALALPGEGGIRIELRHAGEEATIAVRDCGPGLGNSDGSDWWVPFFTTKSGHLGLGLVRVRRIVEALGGRVEVAPNDGLGVEVGLTLPI